MKKITAFVLCLLLLLTAGWNAAFAQEEDFRIGIVTGSRDQAEDDLAGAEAFQAQYGADCVTVVTYPDHFTEERDKVVQIINGLADDPRMKAIVVNQAIPGTAEAFQLVRERRPDILCFAGQTHEDLVTISESANLTVNCDFVARGYLMIHTAHELGCDTFVHISFPRHKAMESMSRRIAIMQAACEELGMRFAEETAPDPTKAGTAEAQAFVTMIAPEWIKKYGQNTAYFCTNDAHTEPLIRQLLAYGGYFIEADLPSPLMGYPGALDIDLSDTGGDFEKMLAAVEEAVCAQGGAGRFGAWTYSFGYTLSAGLAQHAYNVILGESKLLDLDDLFRAFRAFGPGAKWNGSGYTVPDTGEKLEDVVLVYQDTYIMGDPGRYMGAAEVEVPEKYFTIR